MVIFRCLPDGLLRHEHKLLIESIRCLFCFPIFNRDSRGGFFFDVSDNLLWGAATHFLFVLPHNIRWVTHIHRKTANWVGNAPWLSFGVWITTWTLPTAGYHWRTCCDIKGENLKRSFLRWTDFFQVLSEWSMLL